MTAIDYERLELVIGSFIDDSVRDHFNLHEICQNAQLGTYKGVDAITVNGGRFVFIVDAITYEQLHGAGC